MDNMGELPTIDDYLVSPPRADGKDATGEPGGGEPIELLDIDEDSHRVAIVEGLRRGEKPAITGEPNFTRIDIGDEFDENWAQFVELVDQEHLLYSFTQDGITSYLISHEGGLAFIDDEQEIAPLTKRAQVVLDVPVVDMKYLVEVIQGREYDGE